MQKDHFGDIHFCLFVNEKDKKKLDVWFDSFMAK